MKQNHVLPGRSTGGKGLRLIGCIGDLVNDNLVIQSRRSTKLICLPCPAFVVRIVCPERSKCPRMQGRF